MLKLQHLTKRFGTAPLFTDLCMEVDAPVVLWAPSGWGKTTLLRILMGLERPTTGSVEGTGRVAAVFQEDRLCPQLNAVQNVTLVLPGAENQYKEQIISDFQQLGMELAALQLPARRLSGGQKRRVVLLRALWAPSDTLLLDEPFTGMDPDTLQRAAARASRYCWLPTTKAPSVPLAGRWWSWKSWGTLECPPLRSGHDLRKFCFSNMAFVLKSPKKQGRAARGLHVLVL